MADKKDLSTPGRPSGVLRLMFATPDRADQERDRAESEEAEVRYPGR